MKSTLLRVFSAIMVIVLVFSAYWTNDYAQKRIAEDAREKLQAERLAAEQSEKQEQRREEKRIQLEKEKIKTEELNKQKQTYSLQPVDSKNNLFTNKVDVYSVEIPSDLNINMEFSGLRTVLESDNMTVEIYRQELNQSDGSNIDSYINYSNQFINNRIDHTKEMQGTTRISGRAVYFLQWSRRALKSMENDKCHYASVEVPVSENEVITFLFKSNQKFTDRSYLDVIRSMTLIDQSAEPYMQKIHQVENQNWDERTANAYETYFGEDSELQWGIFENGAPVDFAELDKIEQGVDFNFPILLYYTSLLENEEAGGRF